MFGHGGAYQARASYIEERVYNWRYIEAATIVKGLILHFAHLFDLTGNTFPLQSMFYTTNDLVCRKRYPW